MVLAGGVVPRTGGLLTRGPMLIGPGRVISESNFEGKSVAILGGGDNAFENYQFIKKRGAKAVHIYARTLRARAELLEAVPPEHVTEGAYTLREEASSVNGVGYDRIVVLYGYETNRASLLGLEPLMSHVLGVPISAAVARRHSPPHVEPTSPALRCQAGAWSPSMCQRR